VLSGRVRFLGGHSKKMWRRFWRVILFMCLVYLPHSLYAEKSSQDRVLAILVYKMANFVRISEVVQLLMI